jgi:hypothetical protein
MNLIVTISDFLPLTSPPAGVIVRLRAQDQSFVEASTDANGQCTFAGLDGWQYTLTILLSYNPTIDIVVPVGTGDVNASACIVGWQGPPNIVVGDLTYGRWNGNPPPADGSISTTAAMDLNSAFNWRWRNYPFIPQIWQSV